MLMYMIPAAFEYVFDLHKRSTFGDFEAASGLLDQLFDMFRQAGWRPCANTR